LSCFNKFLCALRAAPLLAGVLIIVNIQVIKVSNNPNINSKCMKKLYSLLIIALVVISGRVQGQVAPSFNVHVMKWRFNSTTEAYLAANGYTTDARIMDQSAIVYADNKTRVNLESVRAWLIKSFPNTSSSNYLILNWETGPYVAMRNYPVTDSRFKAAESEFLKLINEVKKLRPNLRISVYQMPFRFWYANQNEAYNAQSKFDNIFSKIDFIAPSYYIMYADEEVGYERNLQYIKENLNVALTLGKKFNKPVIPFMWHKIHPTVSTKYEGEIMQKEAFSRYIKYISNYSYNNYKAAGVWWYDNLGDQLKDVSGINNYLQGSVYDKATYNTMIVNFAKNVKQALNESTGTTVLPVTSQQVASFTLINADNNQDVQTLTSGGTLNLAMLPTKNLNIRANTNPATVGSIKFILSGAKSKSTTETSKPYALFGDSNGDYNTWAPTVGSYTLKAVPYTASGGGGTAGTALTVNFTVVNQAPESSQALVSSVSANTGNSYTVTGLAVGKLMYTDRTYKITTVPYSLAGASLIQTANNDKWNTSSSMLSFNLSQPATVYVAYDPRAAALPSWLNGWQKSTERIGVNDSKISNMNLYSKYFAAGKVTLGGNMASPAKGAENNYFVFVKATQSLTSLSTGGATITNNASQAANQQKEGMALELIVYPNPSSGDKTYVEINNFSKQEAITISVNDMLGRVVFSLNLVTDEQGSAHTEVLKSEHFSTGMYIIKAKAASGKVQSKLFIE